MFSGDHLVGAFLNLRHFEYLKISAGLRVGEVGLQCVPPLSGVSVPFLEKQNFKRKRVRDLHPEIMPPVLHVKDRQQQQFVVAFLSGAAAPYDIFSGFFIARRYILMGGWWERLLYAGGGC
jgi:hypothetical protein